MRSLATRFVVLLLIISVMQAGLFACCKNAVDLKIEPVQHCHPAPLPSHSCCLPTHVVQSIVPESLTSDHRLQLSESVSFNAPSVVRTVQCLTGRAIPTSRSHTAPRISDDLCIQLHAFLI
jgi:hypothetical protein